MLRILSEPTLFLCWCCSGTGTKLLQSEDPSGFDLSALIDREVVRDLCDVDSELGFSNLTNKENVGNSCNSVNFQLLLIKRVRVDRVPWSKARLHCLLKGTCNNPIYII